jgi:hypothetical protein
VGEKTPSGGKVRVYLNTGTASASVFNSFFYAQSEAADLVVPASGCLGAFPRLCDLDGDGKNDLLVGLADGSVLLFPNIGTNAAPTFGPGQVLQAGPAGAKTNLNVVARATLAMVDWNDDGKQDLVVGAMDGKVRVYLNQASPGLPDFADALVIQNGGQDLQVPTGRASVAVCDLNGDGRKDLVVGNTEGQVFFYPNVGTDAGPVFDGSELLEVGGSPIDLEGSARSRPFVGDFNSDGVPDILLGAADGQVRLYRGQVNQSDYAVMFLVSDTTPPSSAVAPLPSTEHSPDFTVSWSGEDDPNGSGLLNYDVYVSTNGQPYVIWQQATIQTSAIFHGQDGDSYRFYSIARDNAGNVEAAPTGPQAVTSVSVPPAMVASVVNGGAAQRSCIDSLSFTFSKAVTIADGSLTLHNDTTWTDIDLSTASCSYDAGCLTATWNLTGVTMGNGNYTATLCGAGVTDAAGNTLQGGDCHVQFFRQLCDANGDRKVDGGELAIWQQNYDPLGLNPGNGPARGDWNGDGKIDGGDLALWQQNYNPIGMGAVSKPQPLQTEQATVNAETVSAAVASAPVLEEVVTTAAPVTTETTELTKSPETTLSTPAPACAVVDTSVSLDVVRLEEELSAQSVLAGRPDAAYSTEPFAAAAADQVAKQAVSSEPLLITVPNAAVVRLSGADGATELLADGCYAEQFLAHKFGLDAVLGNAGETEDVLGLLDPLLLSAASVK